MNGFKKIAVSGSMVAVTGAAGFIGSHLTSALLGGAARVTAIDNLAYGAWENITADKSERLKFVTADLAALSTDDLCRYLEGHDMLLHFAAEKHNNAVEAPQRIIDVNISGAARLLTAAGLAGIKKVVFASSLYAYGRLKGEPMRETDLPAPTTIYGISKLAGEGLLREASIRYGFDFVILRLFFVYGPRQFVHTGYPSVIVRNFSRILKGDQPVIYGDGLQVLDYINVHDVVRSTWNAVEAPISAEIFNVGSGVGVTIEKLTELMLAVSGSRLRPLYGPPDWTSNTQRVCDPSKLRSQLKWTTEVSLEDGILEVWEWMKKAYRS